MVHPPLNTVARVTGVLDGERPPTMRVLVVEDDPAVASVLTRALARDGYSVDVAATGQDAIQCGLESRYAVIVLDVMIPPPDGFTVVRHLRRAGRWVPVLMLTARDRVDDRVEGLHAGADDYLTKPFSVAEVLARVYALARRASLDRPPPTLRVGNLTLDPASGAVFRAGVRISLSGREFDLLHEFMRHPEETLTHAYLSAHVPAPEGARDAAALAVRVERLRDRIDRPFGRESLETVGRDAYRLTAHR